MHILLLLAILSTAPQRQNAINNCQVCHSDIKVQYSQSIHAREEIRCTDCHGGDASTQDRKAAHAGNFRALTDRKQIPDECASCHSSSERMKPYGLSTDQLALYQTSVHGKKLAAGDTQVAVCTDCHGAHRILPPTDPESQTNPRNIPQTCGNCHGDSQRMGAYHISANVVKDYEASIHGKAMRAGNQRAPVCTSCHGTHGAAPPGVGDVSIVCGHCHVTERENFRIGPHKTAMAEAGLPECAACHSNHNIQAANEGLWKSACVQCHQNDSDEIHRARQIESMMKDTRAEIERADFSIQEAAKIPLDVSDYQARLEEARTYAVELLPLTHSLNVNDIEELHRRAKSVSVEIQNEIKEKQKLFKTRRIVLLLVWFYLILTIVIIYQYRKSLESKS
jgi:formate-dependent nitrite reductase cytochrome c552 subunit